MLNVIVDEEHIDHDVNKYVHILEVVVYEYGYGVMIFFSSHFGQIYSLYGGVVVLGVGYPKCAHLKDLVGCKEPKNMFWLVSSSGHVRGEIISLCNLARVNKNVYCGGM